MNKLISILGAGTLLVAGFLWHLDREDLRERRLAALLTDLRFEGPFRHNNLSLFLIRGRDQGDDRDTLTLEAGMRGGTVAVHETSDVNRLEIENIGDRPVFVMAGEIVKGGKQDRVFQNAMLLPPRSGRIRAAAFCVEAGRWEKRGDESHEKFSLSSESLVTKELKRAAIAEKDQSSVWNAVGSFQRSFSSGSSDDSDYSGVRSEKSVTSLQLSLENESLRKQRRAYLEALAGIGRRRADVIGVGFFVNGEAYSVEIFRSNALFRKVWPKLLRGAATQAVARPGKGDAFVVKERDLREYLARSMAGAPATERIGDRFRAHSYKSDEGYSADLVDESGKRIYFYQF